jgi:N-acetylneuraminate synthase/sialic acid synthase
MLPPKPVCDLGNEPVFKKLGKSLVAYRDILAGERLSLENLSGKIFGLSYINVRDAANVINKVKIRLF